MRQLEGRLNRLEEAVRETDRRPVLLLDEGEDSAAALADWQARYGPCDAEPLFVELVALK